jgi:hypothetical protein
MFFNQVKGKVKVKRERSMFVPMDRVSTDIEYMDDKQLVACTGLRMIFDTETYPNYFLAAFRLAGTKKHVCIELKDDNWNEFESRKLEWMMWSFCNVGFNSINYDLPVIYVALKYQNNEAIKACSDMIIQQGATVGDIEREFKIKVPYRLNHIDLCDVVPLGKTKAGGRTSLKTYSGRMHAPRMQDLPYEPHNRLDAEQQQIVKLYCVNDLTNTELLDEHLKPQLALRESMSNQYGQDLRSKSDAQISEAVIISEVKKATGKTPRKPDVPVGKHFFYTPPEFVSYRSDNLRQMLETIRSAEFVIDINGTPQCDLLKEITITIAGADYAMGLGGLHSREKSQCYVASDTYGIFDDDVTGYYPQLMLNSGMYPPAIGPEFQVVFKSLVDRRTIAKKNAGAHKKAGNKVAEAAELVEADSLKITNNGTFGKTGSSFSVIYAPEQMIWVTLTGQLCIIMLIELLTEYGFKVISGNTDGIVIYAERSKKSLLKDIITYWEGVTGLKTEETEYLMLASRDVNNYFALKRDSDEKNVLKYSGECKKKGAYTEKGSSGNTVLSKNPMYLICNDAVEHFLAHKKPIEQTIRECRDFRRFVCVQNVKGGAEKNGVYLGKAVRWYYAVGETGAINYVTSGNQVPRSVGAKPCMDLPLEFPNDVDFAWYINTATEILFDIGYYKRPELQPRLFF